MYLKNKYNEYAEVKAASMISSHTVLEAWSLSMCVDMATVSLATELGHCPCRCCSPISAMKDGQQEEEC